MKDMKEEQMEHDNLVVEIYEWWLVNKSGTDPHSEENIKNPTLEYIFDGSYLLQI